MAHTYDIAILGQTPAGLAAACCLLRKRRSVVIVSTPHQSVECPLADWVPAEFFRLPGLPKGLAAASKAVEFRRVAYHNVRLDKTVESSGRALAGYFIQRGALIKALTAVATKAGAKVKTMTPSPSIRLGEDAAHLDGSAHISSRLLLIAQNHPNEVIGELSLPVRTVPQSPIVVSALDIPIDGRAKVKVLAGALHVVELAERSDLGMFFMVNSMLHVRLISATMAGGTRAAELSSLLGKLQTAQILPSGLALHKARGAIWTPPAGVALDLETHVAKRTLLIGTAGGFADSITGHTLMPSVKSGILSAEVTLAALASANPQDALMRYKTSWRRTMAEYLRPPNTALGMLLPLLFVNQRLVTKFTRALLYGESI